MENKFMEGGTVYAKVAPDVKLMVRRYIDRIYYCQIQNQPEARELAYFERELMPELIVDEIG